MEYRIAKMKGVVDEVDPLLIEKRNCFENICAATRKKYEHIKQQMAVASETERRLQPLFAKTQLEHSELLAKLQNRQTDCENGLRTIASKRDNLHERLVEHSLLQMRVHQMTKMLNKQMEQFYDFEEHKHQLQMAIDERLVDLRCQNEILMMKRKHMRGERDQLRADINERKIKIETIKVRFELTNELLGKNQDGTIVSAIQLKMEIAQEKSLLLDQGSQLNEKVLKAEADIKALENTLILLNYSNDKYKRKMGQAQHNGENFK